MTADGMIGVMHELNSLRFMRLTVPSSAYLLCAALVWALTAVGCSTTPPNVLLSKPVPSRLSEEQANELTLTAIGLVGTPYRYGGNTPASGFDCSGLIRHVHQERAGVLPPRSVSGLVAWGLSVPQEEVRTGDLVIFVQGASATHAGIYVGGGRFVHAPSTGGEVRLDQLKSKYWSAQQVAFRRP